MVRQGDTRGNIIIESRRWKIEQTDTWSDKEILGRTNSFMSDKPIYGQKSRHMIRQTDTWSDKEKPGQTSRYVVRRVDTWSDKQIHDQICRYMSDKPI